MKLKLSEVLFIVICIAAAAVSVAAVYIMRDGRPESDFSVSFAEEPEGYDVSVINAASIEDFMSVKGIGEVKASNIVSYRSALGGFARVSQLLDVNGISEQLYNNIIDHFYNSPAPAVTTATAEITVPATSAPPETTPPETEPPKTEAPPDKTEPKKTESPKTSIETKAQTAETEPVERVRRSVNINEASAEEIADALLIDIEIAREITDLRDKIHYYSTVQEITLCDSISADMYSELKYYILLE